VCSSFFTAGITHLNSVAEQTCELDVTRSGALGFPELPFLAQPRIERWESHDGPSPTEIGAKQRVAGAVA